MKTNLSIFILIIILFINADSIQAASCLDNNDNRVDTCRVIYYLDGKKVPYSTIREKGEKGELGDGIGENEHKKAILQYGEKFRYGVFFTRSRDEEERGMEK